jgi:hypothetical protein
MDVTKLQIPKCRGVVIECGYESKSRVDEVNRFKSHIKVEARPTTYFKWEQVA